ncbi:MAG: 50S ribosomal protein L32 [Patescibacteria group bacterium]|nr:50S ribosomal protein L32 [Patescibacteria group bacterium]MCL5095421.1 50S ribosomal protein L32 [Patescibacteria group bacterium]
MTPLPKRRLSTARSSKRTRALKLARTSLVTCPHCGQLTKPHLVCPSCGQYNKKVVIPQKPKEKSQKNP